MEKKKIGIIKEAVTVFCILKILLTVKIQLEMRSLSFLLCLYYKCSSDISLFPVAFSGHIVDAFVCACTVLPAISKLL